MLHLLNRLFFVVLPFSFCFSASRRLSKNLQESVLRQRYIVVRQEGSHTPSQRLGLSHILVVLLLVWSYLMSTDTSVCNGGEVV